MRKRNHVIPLHLNKRELEYLEAQVKLSGQPREEYLRTLIMGAQVRPKPCIHPVSYTHLNLFRWDWSDGMKVVMVEPGQYARIEELDTGLESLQKAVGGLIDCARCV